jgi:hypothetical protein
VVPFWFQNAEKAGISLTKVQKGYIASLFFQCAVKLKLAPMFPKKKIAPNTR